MKKNYDQNRFSASFELMMTGVFFEAWLKYSPRAGSQKSRQLSDENLLQYFDVERFLPITWL